MTWFANPVNCRNKKHLLHCIINHGIHLVIIMMNSPGLISNSGFRVILGTLFVMQLQGVEGGKPITTSFNRLVSGIHRAIYLCFKKNIIMGNFCAR